jgi:hypothetical protein
MPGLIFGRMWDNSLKGVIKMRFWMKAAITGVLILTAAFSAFRAVRSIQASAEKAPSISYQWTCAEEDAQFVLRDYEGYIGVFNSGSKKKPITVTNIEIGDLREADRAMIAAGIAVSDRDELLTLLEDLGS